MALSFVVKRRPNIGWAAVISNSFFTKENNLLFLILKVAWLLMTYRDTSHEKMPKREKTRDDSTPTAHQIERARVWRLLLERSDRPEGCVCSSGKVACWTTWAPPSRYYAEIHRVHYTWKAYRGVLVLAEDFWTNGLSDWTVRGNVFFYFLIVFNR
jgi:hypothetical protein